MKKKGILNNMGLKLISFAIALTLWIFVTYRGQSEIIVDVPIEFKNIPKGVEILRQSAKEVSLNISGPDRLLKVLRPSDIRVTVDLSNAKKGESLYYLDKRNVEAPSTIKVQRIEPTSLKVILDELIAKTVPVKAQIVGEPQRGFKITEIIVNPSSIIIEGAKTEINKVSILRTDPIEITGLDENLTQSVKINTTGRNIKTNISEVTVTIKIKKIER